MIYHHKRHPITSWTEFWIALGGLILLAIGIGFILAGCGGGQPLGSHIPSEPVSQPAPPPAPPPVPTQPEPPPTPPPTPPPPSNEPVIQTLGPGANPLVDSAGNVAWQNGANIEPMKFPGQLTDYQAGHVLAYEIDSVSQLVSLWLDNEPVPGAANVDYGGARLTTDGLGAAWTQGGSAEILLNGVPLAPPTTIDYEEISVAGEHVAWAVMPGEGQTCQVYVDGTLVMDDQKGECFDLTLRQGPAALYVGWANGQGFTLSRSTDGGATWSTQFQIGGLDGVYGASYNIVGSDSRAYISWIQRDDQTGATAVWQSISGDAPTRVSGPARSGANGASNPLVLEDGRVAFLDDSHGQATSGDYDVLIAGLDGSVTTLTDGTHEIDQLSGVATSAGASLAWSDSTTVWATLVP